MVCDTQEKLTQGFDIEIILGNPVEAKYATTGAKLRFTRVPNTNI